MDKVELFIISTLNSTLTVTYKLESQKNFNPSFSIILGLV